MASGSRTFLSFTAITLTLTLLASTTTASAPNPSSAAAALCRNSDTPALCRRISGSLRDVTPVTMTAAAIKIATKVAVRAKAKAAFLALVPRLSARQKSGVESCAASYGDVVDALSDSAGFLVTSRTRADVMNYLSAASFGVTTCEDEFREVARAEFPLARINKTLRKYVSNALAMGDQLSLRW